MCMMILARRTSGLLELDCWSGLLCRMMKLSWAIVQKTVSEFRGESMCGSYASWAKIRNKKVSTWSEKSTSGSSVQNNRQPLSEHVAGKSMVCWMYGYCIMNE